MQHSCVATWASMVSSLAELTTRSAVFLCGLSTEHYYSTSADLQAARPFPVMNLVLRQSCDTQPPGLGCTFQLMTCFSTCLTATALDQQACSGFDQMYKHLHWQNLIDLKM